MADPVERIDVRLSPEHKRLIERAAAVKGHSSVGGFAAVELVEVARATLEAYDVQSLSSRDWDRFTEIMDRNKPNAELVKAAKAYRKKHGT